MPVGRVGGSVRLPTHRMTRPVFQFQCCKEGSCINKVDSVSINGTSRFILSYFIFLCSADRASQCNPNN